MSVSTISKEAPSQFAALLRRSKFASYDQKIGQIYTAHGGYAHRGDWGLKRPLPNKIRVRRPMIKISNVDSFNEQTEWERRGPAARFVAQWNEMGMDQAKPDDGGIGSDTSAPVIDSEFARAPGAGPFVRAAGPRAMHASGTQSHKVPVPNIEKMRPAEFERYLARLRTLRPKFKQYIIDLDEASRNRGGSFVDAPAAKEQRAPPRELHMHLASVNASSASLPELFISQEASLSASGARAAWIEQRPHPIGALSYTETGALQSHLLFAPVKGRLITSTQSTNARADKAQPTQYIAAVSGIAATVEARGSGEQSTMDFGPYTRPDEDENKYAARNPTKGVVPLRITRATVHRVPRVVGDRTEDLATRTEINNVAAEPWDARQIVNPCLPGSPEWVAVEAKTPREGPGKVNHLTIAPIVVQPPAKKKLVSAKVLGMLTNILVNPPQGKEEDGWGEDEDEDDR